MKTAFNAAAVLAAFAALGAAAPTLQFDQGVNVRAIVQELGKGSFVQNKGIGFPRHIGWMPGTKDVTLNPGETASPSFTLSSTELVEECNFDPRTGEHCYQTFGMTVRETLRIVMDNRPAVQAAEVFRVWLEGHTISVDVLRSPYKYNLRIQGNDLHLSPKP